MQVVLDSIEYETIERKAFRGLINKQNNDLIRIMRTLFQVKQPSVTGKMRLNAVVQIPKMLNATLENIKKKYFKVILADR